MLLLLFVSQTHSAAAGDADLVDRLLQLVPNHGSLCAQMPGSDVTRAELSEAAEVLRSRLAEVRAIESMPSRDEARQVVAALNGVVFNHLGIRPSQDLHDPCNLLPSGVLARRQGYCVGIAAVYLVLAKQLDLPVHAVATPSHVFLQYDAGTHRINIETFSRGAPVPDDQYIAEQKIAPRSLRKGIFLRVLTDDRFLAQVHNNLGVIYSERGDFNRAAAEYEEALRLDPRLPAAWYNWGKDLQRQGDHRRAIRYFSKCLHLHPNDAWALNNRGLAYRALGKLEKARRDFEEALRIDPGFETARANLAALDRQP